MRFGFIYRKKDLFSLSGLYRSPKSFSEFASYTICAFAVGLGIATAYENEWILKVADYSVGWTKTSNKNALELFFDEYEKERIALGQNVTDGPSPNMSKTFVRIYWTGTNNALEGRISAWPIGHGIRYIWLSPACQITNVYNSIEAPLNS